MLKVQKRINVCYLFVYVEFLVLVQKGFDVFLLHLGGLLHLLHRDLELLNVGDFQVLNNVSNLFSSVLFVFEFLTTKEFD